MGTFCPDQQIIRRNKAGSKLEMQTEIFLDRKYIISLVSDVIKNGNNHLAIVMLIIFLDLAHSSPLLYTTDHIQLARNGTHDMIVLIAMSTSSPVLMNRGSSINSMYLKHINNIKTIEVD